VENTAPGYKTAKKLLTFASAASTLVSRVNVAEFESTVRDPSLLKGWACETASAKQSPD